MNYDKYDHDAEKERCNPEAYFPKDHVPEPWWKFSKAWNEAKRKADREERYRIWKRKIGIEQ